MSAIDPDTSEEPIPERRPNSGTGSKVVFIGSDLYSVVTQHAIAVREALIYSIFRPCNALEALIYLGATAGF